MKHIVIAANPYRDSGLQKALTVYRMLTEHGHRVVMSPVFAPKAYLPGDVPVRPLEAAAHDAALIIVMGGDGTILHVAVTLRDHPIPIIGVNFGGKGFLAGLEDDELDMLLEIADGQYTVSRRMMLDVELVRNERIICTQSVLNDVVIHGIPDDTRLKYGDIVSVDVGARYRGFNGDCAGTFPCGKCSDEALRLIRITRQSFFEGIQFARVGYRISDIGHAVQEYAESYGYSLVREYVGHGVGRNMHEAPEIPNYGAPGHGPKLLRGMTIAVEPMVNAGTAAIRQMSDGWTVKTRDGKYAAHYENTILITADEPEILTAPAP